MLIITMCFAAFILFGFIMGLLWSPVLGLFWQMQDERE
jgi:hypothetical protein